MRKNVKFDIEMIFKGSVPVLLRKIGYTTRKTRTTSTIHDYAEFKNLFCGDHCPNW